MIFNSKRYQSLSAVANKWGCSQSTILNYIKRGLIPGAFKHNGRWHIPYEAEMPTFDDTKPGIKPGNAQRRKQASSQEYGIWLNDIERHEWSKLFFEV